MKKQGILNRDIAAVLARLGHTDKLAISDCGLPVPDHVPCIDLSLRIGTPPFQDVLDEILKDMVVEKMILAEEIKTHNQPLHSEVMKTNIPARYVPHESFKQELSDVKVIIRTGEATPYANVILQADVIF